MAAWWLVHLEHKYLHVVVLQALVEGYFTSVPTSDSTVTRESDRFAVRVWLVSVAAAMGCCMCACGGIVSTGSWFLQGPVVTCQSMLITKRDLLTPRGSLTAP